MTSISGGSGPSFRIGSTGPTDYASFTNSSPTWGSAIAQMGNAWASAHNKRKSAEADRQLKSEQSQKRTGWAKQLGEGATVRDIAMRDPSIIGDASFLAFLDKTKTPKGFEDVLDDQGRPIAQRGPQGRTFAHPLAPEPEGPAPEMFEDVLNPHGFGGAAQRSSTTGELTGYRAAPSQPQAPARRTAKDMHGRLRYTDDSAPVFADSIFDQGGTPPKAAPPPLKEQLAMVRQLSDDWRETTKPMQGLLDQADRMSIGLRMAQGAQMLAGSQAILISFNKLLDPTSVVRESEYARSATGQSALETMRGFVDKLKEGGAGVTLKELESYKEFGEQVVQKALESSVAPERERISRLVEFAGVDPELIFTGRFASGGEPRGAAPQGAPQAAQGLPQAAALPQTQAASSPGFAALAKALAGQGAPARAPAYTAAGVGPARASSLPAQRVQDYATLKSDALKRQVTTMAEELAANPKAYSQEEIDAAKIAYDRAFPER